MTPAIELLPASMAGLPATSAIVWVGPPLFARAGAMPGRTPTRLPLVAFASPPALRRARDQIVRAGGAERAGDVAWSEPSVPVVLSATSVLYSVAVPPVTSSPPPVVDAWL